MDHSLTSNELLTGRYGSQSNDRYTPLTFATVGGQAQPQRFQNSLLSLTSTFTPTLLNEAHFSYSRTVNRTQGQNTGNPIAASAGIPFAPTSGFNSGFPESIGIGSSTITGLSEAQPWFLTVNTFQWYDGITWIKGKHTLKAGADVRRVRADALIATHENNGYTFSGQFSGDGFSDFLLGCPSTETLVLGSQPSGPLPRNESSVLRNGRLEGEPQPHHELRGALRILRAAKGIERLDSPVRHHPRWPSLPQ